MGLTIRLSSRNAHRPGESCQWGTKSANFVIVDISGIHEVAIEFCGCGDTPPYIQLLRMRLYPATFNVPSTAFTFQLLRDFLTISFNTRLSQHHFFDFLHQKADNTGLREIPVSGLYVLLLSNTSIFITRNGSTNFTRLCRNSASYLTYYVMGEHTTPTKSVLKTPPKVRWWSSVLLACTQASTPCRTLAVSPG
jgi:hypothetical protein